MNVLIAHDPDPNEPLPLADLRRAGFDADSTVLVVSIADVLPPPAPEGASADQSQVPARVQAALDNARRGAASAQAELLAEFPSWTIDVDTLADAPAWGIVRKAESWGADIIVVGAHRRSALSRLVLGSVSQKVLHESTGSVHIVRRGTIETFREPRLLVGIDGSAHAEAAVSAVAARHWPKGTVAHIVHVDSTDDGETAAAQTAARAHVERAARGLADRGMTLSVAVIAGDPAPGLLTAAETFKADCIFLGARGLSAIERMVLGSVSATIAAQAPCSVEIVRRRSRA